MSLWKYFTSASRWRQTRKQRQTPKHPQNRRWVRAEKKHSVKCEPAVFPRKPFRLTPLCKVHNEDRENVGRFICAVTQTQSHRNRSRAARAKIWRTHRAFSKAVRFLQVWHMLFCFYFTLSFGRVCRSSLQNLRSIINCEIYALNSSYTFHRQHTVVFFQLATIQLRLLTLTLRGDSQPPSSVWYEANTNENQLEEKEE